MGTTVQENLTYSVNPGGTILFAVAVGTLVITFGVFCLRAYVKIGMTRKITQDDLWMTAGMIQFIPYMVIVTIGPSHGGTGRHTTDLSPKNIELALWTWAICEVLYPPISFCVRMSVACFLHRLAVVTIHKRIIVGVMIANLLLTIAYWIIMLVQCIPLSYFWQRHLGAQGYCIDPNVVPWGTIIHAVLGACLDWILAFLPIAMLWSVRINRRTKAAVSAVLGLGVFCGISLIARIPFIKAIAVSPDFLHATTGIATVAIIEPGVGIIAGSLVTLQPLLQRFKLGFASHSSSSASRGRRRGGGGGLPPHNGSGGYNARSGDGSSSGGGNNKYGIHSRQNSSWKERRGSASARNAKQWGYPVPLSTFMNSIRGASEEELRRAEAGSRDGEGGVELDEVMHHDQQQQQEERGRGDEQGWEVRVSATPKDHQVDLERGHEEEEEEEELTSPRLSGIIVRPGIAVTRDVKVTSTYVRDKSCHEV